MLRLPTFGKIPYYEPKFEPWGFWLMRPVWWRQASSHILCGDPRAGKTTFIHAGIHELSSTGLYDPRDLKELPAVRKTKNISRFSLERRSWNPMIDSWIDVDGERFLESFRLDRSEKDRLKAVERIYDRVNSMVILLSAQRLLDIHRHLEGGNKKAAEVAADYIDGIVERKNGLNSSVRQKVKRAGFRWHLLISQCGDTARTQDDRDALTSALRYFADKTGLRSSCRRAIMFDSKHEPLVARGLPVATLATGPRGGLIVEDESKAHLCSAGVAMAIILNRLNCTSSQCSFIQSLNS